MRMISPVGDQNWAKCGGFRPKVMSWPEFDPKRPNSSLTFDTFPVKIVLTFGAQMRLAEQSRNSG